jgi:hypothetical protein
MQCDSQPDYLETREGRRKQQQLQLRNNQQQQKKKWGEDALVVSAGGGGATSVCDERAAMTNKVRRDVSPSRVPENAP